MRRFAKPQLIDGLRFASKAEARRYGELKLMEKAGEIGRLSTHPSWQLEVNNCPIGRYTADFCYSTETIACVVEDVKGWKTTKRGKRVAILNRENRYQYALMRALYGIEVRLVE